MAFGAMPKDANGIPIACIYVPNVGFIALEGAVTTPSDGSSNESAGVIHAHAAVTVLNLPSSARATYSSGLITVSQFAELALDIKVTAFTGGTSPTVTFKLSRQGADGNLYQVYLPTAISAAGIFSTSVGSGFATNACFAGQVQLDMVTTGAPTSVTFSGSLIGK